MIEPLRPQYFITRQNGIMVPLVALDELPVTVSLRGVPRTLSPYDVAGMTSLGTVESHHRQYVVEGLQQRFQPKDNAVKNELVVSKYAHFGANDNLESSFSGLGLRSRPPNATADRSEPKAYGIEETHSDLPKSLNLTSMRNAEAVSRPLTIEDLARSPAPGVKEYCSYWLRHGECDYAQQGCLYRHEMPLDPPTLEKLGLRDIPRWYREKHGLGSYLALSAQGAGSENARSALMERNWRSHLDGTSSRGTKSSATSPELRNENDINDPSQITLGRGTISTDSRNGAHNANSRGLLNSPPIIGRRACPFPNLPANKLYTSKSRPGSRLVPANTEAISARVLREASEQLDAHEERERAALQKYTPLLPQNAGAAVTPPNVITPPSSEHDSSSVDTSAVPAADSTDMAELTDVTATPVSLASNAVRQAENAAAPLAAKKRAGGRTRTRLGRGRADVDREAQRRAVARARLQAEERLARDLELEVDGSSASQADESR